MKPRKELIFFALIVPMLLSAQTLSKVDGQLAYEKLGTLLKQGTVAKVKVLHVNDSTETRVAITRQALRSLATFNQDFSEHIGEKFGSLFSEVSVKKESQRPDCRWGVFLYDAQGQEVGFFIVDKFGDRGYVNDEIVLFKMSPPASNLAKLLHRITNRED